MMRLFSCAAIFLCFFSAVHAREVTVRSGDHGSFSRIAFDFDKTISWKIERVDDTATIRFDASGYEFDISSVYRRINRERINDVSVDNNAQTVTLDIECDCVVEGFWHSTTMLVIDVKDPEEIQEVEVSDTATGLTNTRKFERGPRIPSVQPFETTHTQFALPSNRLIDMTRGPLASDPAINKTGSETYLRSQEHLLKELGRAATQGLLSPKTRNFPGMSSESQTVIEGLDASDVEPTLRPPPSANLHINVQTSIDRGFLEALSENDNARVPQTCLPDAAVDVTKWGTDLPFWDQVGPLRANLSQEFDLTDELVAKKLTKAYIYFGFGLEAQQVAGLIPNQGKETEILLALAYIMNGEDAPSDILAGQLDCDGPSALWSAMSKSSFPKDARVDADSILRSFSALPNHLRAYIGPRLARSFLTAGMMKESAQILRVLNRVEDTQSPDAEFVEAEHALVQGETQAGDLALQDVVAANSAPSVDALIKRVDALLKRGDPVPFDLAQLAAAYAFEYSDAEQSDDLARVHVLALAASDAFDLAFSELARHSASLDYDMTSVRADLFALLSKNADDMTFLKHVLPAQSLSTGSADPITIVNVAARLFDLGFTERSAELSSQIFEGPNARAAKLLRAKIALQQGFPRRAEVEVLGLTGRDVNTLRARARSVAGEHEQAADLFASVGMQQESERELWLANDWSTESASEAMLRENENQTPERQPNQSGGLEENRSLVADAGKTREALRSLLSQAPMPVVIEN